MSSEGLQQWGLKWLAIGGSVALVVLVLAQADEEEVGDGLSETERELLSLEGELARGYQQVLSQDIDPMERRSQVREFEKINAHLIELRETLALEVAVSMPVVQPATRSTDGLNPSEIAIHELRTPFIDAQRELFATVDDPVARRRQQRQLEAQFAEDLLRADVLEEELLDGVEPEGT